MSYQIAISHVLKKCLDWVLQRKSRLRSVLDTFASPYSVVEGRLIALPDHETSRSPPARALRFRSPG